MTTFNSLTSAGNVDLNPEQLATIFNDAAQQSVVLGLGRRLRNMTTNELKLRVSSALPSVYFVGTKGTTSLTWPTGTAAALKQTTTSEWDNVEIYAGELAAIVVIPNNVFNDADFDVFGEIRAQMPTAIGKKVDSAVLYGTAGVDVPGNWSNGVFTDMPATSKVTAGALGDLYDDILGPSGTYSRVEKFGYDVDGNAAAVSFKADLRGLRVASDGVPIFSPSPQVVGAYVLGGVPIQFPKNGAFDVTKAKLICGEWQNLVYSFRQDVAFDVFTQGVIQNESGTIQHNLLQEDLTALRVTFRMAWGLPQPLKWIGGASPYPFSALIP